LWSFKTFGSFTIFGQFKTIWIITIFGQCITCFYRILHAYNLYIKYNLYNVSIYSISNTHLLQVQYITDISWQSETRTFFLGPKIK
jgi:hypothetical protein